MKNPINKRIFRQVRFYPLRFFPIFILIVLVVSFSASFYTAQDSVKTIYYKELKDGKVEDGQFTSINKLDQKTIKNLEKKDIKLYENFSIEVNESKDKKLRGFINRDKINIGLIHQGRFPKAKNEIALSNNYANINKIKLNDKIKLEGKTFNIVGLVSLPDYSSLLRNRQDLVMDTGYFGVCLFNKEGFDSFDKISAKYTYSYHNINKINKKEQRKKIRKIVEEINKNNFVIDYVIRADNHNISYLIDDMNGDVPSMTSFMIVLFIALAFVSAVEIKSLIEKEAPLIGTLLSLGYKKKEIFINYMAMPLFITIIGALMGNLISYLFIYKKYVNLYYNSFDIAKFQLKLTPRSFIITSIIPILIYLLIDSIIIYKSLKYKPLDFLRKNFKKPRQKNKFQLEKFNFINKFRIRIISANKLNLTALFFGIFLANLLLIISLSIKPVFTKYADDMKKSMKYDYTYFVKAEDKNIKEEKASIIEGELVGLDDKNIQIYGVDKTSKYKINSYDYLKDNDVIVSQGFVDKYALKKGDEFKIREPYKNKVKKLKIKDVDKSVNFFKIFMKRKSLNKLIGKDEKFFNTYMADEKLNISKDIEVSKIDKKEITKFTKHFLGNFSVFFDVMTVIGVLFFFIITMLISNVIIDKSKTNISYIKTFGFKNKEITKIYISPIFIFLIIFQILMIPLLNKIIQVFMLISMSKLDAYIKAQIPIKTYAISVLVSILLFILVQVIQKIKISRINMVEELKVING